MKQRLLVAAIGVPLLIVVLVILPPVAAWILTAAIAAAAAWELLHTAGKHVTPLVYALTMLMAVLTVAYISMDGWWTAVGDRLYFACAYVFVAALFLIAVLTHGKETALPFVTVAVCIVGGLLFPAMYSCIFLLRMDEHYGKLYLTDRGIFVAKAVRAQLETVLTHFPPVRIDMTEEERYNAALALTSALPERAFTGEYDRLFGPDESEKENAS